MEESETPSHRAARQSVRALSARECLASAAPRALSFLGAASSRKMSSCCAANAMRELTKRVGPSMSSPKKAGLSVPMAIDGASSIRIRLISCCKAAGTCPRHSGGKESLAARACSQFELKDRCPLLGALRPQAGLRIRTESDPKRTWESGSLVPQLAIDGTIKRRTNRFTAIP